MNETITQKPGTIRRNVRPARSSAATAGLLLVPVIVGTSQPIITTQPQSLTNLAGTTAAFSAAASGTAPLVYQWLFNSALALSQATNADLALTNVQSANAGGYSVIVSNLEGAATSTVATLTVLTPPTIIRQPANQTASLFADTTFRVSATGDAPLSYQWRFSDTDVSDMRNVVMNVRNVQRTNAGNYSVVVTNLYGSVTSQVASLTITPFNSIYEFGYSWTDTQGIGCSWDPPDFYLHSACNGPMWPEFLSTNLGLDYVAANNYAHCGATTEQIEQQVTGLRPPLKPQLSIYFLWDERTDVPLNQYLGALTNESLAIQLNRTDVLANSNAVHLLYVKGARAIVVQNLIGTVLPGDAKDLGTNSPAAQAFETTFMPVFAEAMNSFSRTHPDVRITLVDVSSNLNEVIAEPTLYGFTKTAVGALEDPTLTDKSFTGPGANYVYWNKRHGTTKLHHLIAAWTLKAINEDVLEGLEATFADGSLIIRMNHLQIGRDYTLQSSPDLRVWQDVQSFTASAGTRQWSGSPGSGSAAYFRLGWRR